MQMWDTKYSLLKNTPGEPSELHIAKFNSVGRNEQICEEK